MDLSALFGPQPVFVTNEQAAAITSFFADEPRNIGFIVENPGAGTVTAYALRGNFEGARAIPTESEPVLDSGVVVTSTGETFPFDSQESLEGAYESAVEASRELLDAVADADRNRVEELV